MVDGKDDDRILKRKNVKRFAISLEISKKWNLNLILQFAKRKEKIKMLSPFNSLCCYVGLTNIISEIFYHSSNCKALYKETGYSLSLLKKKKGTSKKT